MPTYTGSEGTRLRALLHKQADFPRFGRHPDDRVPQDDPARRVVHRGTLRFTDEPDDTITTDFREVQETLAEALDERSRLTSEERQDVDSITSEERDVDANPGRGGSGRA